MVEEFEIVEFKKNRASDDLQNFDTQVADHMINQALDMVTKINDTHTYFNYLKVEDLKDKWTSHGKSEK